MKITLYTTFKMISYKVRSLAFMSTSLFQNHISQKKLKATVPEM